MKHDWWVNKKLLNKQNHASSGFTLTELIVVVVLAGILASIAAPGWLAFVNRQKVSTENKKIFQVMREAQSNAIAKRATYGILLDPDAPGGPTITKFSAKGLDLTDATQFDEISTVVLGGENFELRTIPPNPANPIQYRFNFDGSVSQDFIPDSGEDDYVYKIEISNNNSRRCIIMDTLLGAMSEGSGDECDA